LEARTPVKEKKKKLRLRRITTQTKSDGTTTILNEDLVYDERVIAIYLKAKVGTCNNLSPTWEVQRLFGTYAVRMLMPTGMVVLQEAGNNPVAALAAAEGLANADGLKSRGSIRIMSAVEEAQLAEERRIRRREQVRRIFSRRLPEGSWRTNR
jgi:hypothetical protein